MNPVRLVLLLAALGFVVLWLRSPKNPKPAVTYLRWVLLAGASILYDTSNVLRHYSEDSHVAAALELFASVALMFWYVLQLFMSLNRRD